MAIVKQVQKKVIMSKKDIIKFQLLTHCYVNKITVKNKLIKKDSKNKKLITVNPNLKIETVGTIFLDYKFLGK